jgi:ketosteroid isomerase-like protein
VSRCKGRSSATSASGKTYSNAYSWLFRFADDKIASLREYFDTNLARIALFG